MLLFKYYRLLRQRYLAIHHKRPLIDILEKAEFQVSLNEKVLWIKQLVDWLRSPIIEQQEDNSDSYHREDQSIRLKLLIKTLEGKIELRKFTKQLLTSVLAEIDPLDYFCDAGMITSHAFFREFLYRAVLRYLPIYQDYTSLSIFMKEVFDESVDVDWMESIDLQLLQELITLLDFEPAFIDEIKLKYSSAIHQAIKILSIRLGSLTSLIEFRNRVPPQDRFLLIDTAEYLSSELLERGHKVTEDVYQSLQSSGVSIELVFQIERIKSLLIRLQNLMDVVQKPQSSEPYRSLVCAILRAQQEKNSISGFLSANLKLISQKIVERAGVTGEHYIARNAKESRELFSSAAGGGLLTVITTLLKTIITNLGLPLFFEGFLAWLNYALSFMVLQFAHFTLATKTPAMTASVLASKLKGTQDVEAQIEFAREVRHIFLSGLLAVMGNVIFVILGAAAVDFLLFTYTGNHFLSQASAVHYLEDHHLLLSLTLWYAAYTGGVLWLGSAMGGWFENWYAYRGLQRAMEESYFFQALFGKTSAQKIAHWFSQNIMGIATNFSLGFLLAFSGVVGKFFGLPLAVRHVTLSSGAIGFSLVALENIQEHSNLVFFASVSILFIGFLNFSVSFIISLFVAAQARGVRLGQYPRLFRYLFSFKK